MKTYTFSAWLLKRIVGVIVFLGILQGCNNLSDSDSVPIPVKSQKPFDPIEELADKMIQDPAFLAILEQQVWMNNQVEEFLFSAPEVERSAVLSVIQSWQGTTYEFSAEDWDIAQKVLGFPDANSLERYQSEMEQRMATFAKNYNSIQISVEEQERLGAYLADRILLDFPKPDSGAALEKIEFRVADCCCAETNECSRTQCFRYDQCADNVWTLYLAELGTGASVGAIGGFPGVALGVSAAAIFGGVHVGHQLHECWETYIRDCQEICDCQ